MNIVKIIVAVDFSEFSFHIAEYACRLGNDLGAELIFVNVINQRDIDMVKKIPLYSYQLSVKGFLEDYKNNRTVKMNGLLKEINCLNVPHRFIIKKGIPFKELIATAKEEQAEMIVMGTKGRSNISGLLTGSQADKMFRHCPIPLISIREK